MVSDQEAFVSSMTKSGLIDQLVDSITEEGASLKAKSRAKLVRRVWELLLDIAEVCPFLDGLETRKVSAKGS